MQTAPGPVLRVACADKVHNVRSTVADLRRYGDATWGKFGGAATSSCGTTDAVGAVRRRLPGPLSEELARLVRR